MNRYFRSRPWANPIEEKAFAARLRASMTPAETRLWETLKDGLDGFRFRPQVPMAGYVLDFFCSTENLVVEVDGPIHDFQKAKDKRRDARLKRGGLKILRLTNDDVMNNLSLSLLRIRQSLPNKPSIGRWPW